MSLFSFLIDLITLFQPVLQVQIHFLTLSTWVIPIMQHPLRSCNLRRNFYKRAYQNLKNMIWSCSGTKTSLIIAYDRVTMRQSTFSCLCYCFPTKNDVNFCRILSLRANRMEKFIQTWVVQLFKIHPSSLNSNLCNKIWYDWSLQNLTTNRLY